MPHQATTVGRSQKELMGLLGIVDDGTILTTFQGLLRATYQQWNAETIDASAATWGGVLSDDLIIRLDQDVYQIGNGRTDTLACSRSAWRAYLKSLKSDRMYTMTPGESQDYTGGGRRLKVDLGDKSLELRAIRKCPPQSAFLLERESLKRWHNVGWFWDDTTGSIWNRVTDGTGRKDAYYAVGAICMETGCLAPAHNGLVRNLTAA